MLSHFHGRELNNNSISGAGAGMCSVVVTLRRCDLTHNTAWTNGALCPACLNTGACPPPVTCTGSNPPTVEIVDLANVTANSSTRTDPTMAALVLAMYIIMGIITAAVF